MKDWQIRQSFLGAGSEKTLRNTRVGIIGLGGGGSHLAQQLAHIGVGKFVLCDFDRYEDKNHNRTVGGLELDVEQHTPKVRVGSRLIGGIHSKADICLVEGRWQEGLASLRDCDVLFGCVDTYTERNQLEQLSRRFLIPYIDIGMDVGIAFAGHAVHGQVILSLPGSLCMWCFNFLRRELLELQAQRYGGAGGRPQVIWPNGVLASTAIGLFMQLILPWHGGVPEGSVMLDYDGNRHTVSVSPRVAALAGVTCQHFEKLEDIGDPMWGRERPELRTLEIVAVTAPSGMLR